MVCQHLANDLEAAVGLVLFATRLDVDKEHGEARLVAECLLDEPKDLLS